MAASSSEIRDRLLDALRLDLVGPDNDHPFARELLSDTPSRWYLTGFLVPREAPEEQRTDILADDQTDVGGDGSGGDDDTPPEPVEGRSFLPSSLGLSVLVAAETRDLHVRVTWGDYRFEGERSPESTASEEPEEAVESPDTTPTSLRRGWRRTPREESCVIQLPETDGKGMDCEVPNSRGLRLSVICRRLDHAPGLPQAIRAVSVFLVNQRLPDAERGYRAFAFQAQLTLHSDHPFVARPDPRGSENNPTSEEWDELVAEVQYRNLYEYAVGHGCAATPLLDPDAMCRAVRSEWLPQADVERVAPAGLPGVLLEMETLAELPRADVTTALMPLVDQYRLWIAQQRTTCAALNERHQKSAQQLLGNADRAAQRIAEGIVLLTRDADALFAFQLANRCMTMIGRRREAQRMKCDPASVAAPRWRPFQLAYLLMTIRGVAEPLHEDREIVDLLFFPTGGGKTEAYFGLAAFTLVLRRLRHPGIRSAGVSVLMRYTLRLLTLDQLGRAAALVCALELERLRQPEKLGSWPFEIGLWVGSAATPNRMGSMGYDGPGADKTAYKRLQDFRRSPKSHATPIPIENCPWCGNRFEPESFRLVPSVKQPRNLEIHCSDERCDFGHGRALPIVAVDEPIYRRLPAFLIATVDKFASLPWTGQTGALFGRVERYSEQEGFYGPMDATTMGRSLGGRLPPPDLIIQDELHLISGPLGTIAGLYETVIDALASWQIEERTIRPKVIASTATVRRADRQIRTLFARPNVAVFPPPGPDIRDSFFAVTERVEQAPARRYVGVAAQGRSLKVVLLRCALAILSAAQTQWQREGGSKAKTNPVDPYMTLLGYFNSLRELGGSRRIIEDEVRTRLEHYQRRRRLEPADDLFVSRKIQYEVLELTSRVSTAGVADAKRKLSLPFADKERVDVAFATNMISVGLDITRLGLMMVLGQPKTSAEYIQSTSRVGRDRDRPGLVITLLNVHKARDRSHYEHFGIYHAGFYRAVEATSVTPFSPRALDRALPGALVALCRHWLTELVPPAGAEGVTAHRAALDHVARLFGERAFHNAACNDLFDTQELQGRVERAASDLLDAWERIAKELKQTGTHLQYQRYELHGPQRLLIDFLDAELSILSPDRQRFRVNRSMRDVEPSVELMIRDLHTQRAQP
ncbi:MAG: DISARM system helicase DrmA [Magnetococcus sp. MYC-9]